MTDHRTISAYDSQVDTYATLIEQQPEDQLLLSFIARFKPNDYVLDLGCGPAVSSAIMREHGLRVDPTDASKEMVKLANNTFDIGARQAVFDDIDSTETYDGIWANFSLLHATPEALPLIIKSLYRSLKPAGLFHLTMKTGTGSARDKFDRFYSYYSQAELTAYLNNAGFSVDKVELGETRGMAGDIEQWIGLLCSA